jgi:hypothetical protein
VRIPEANGRDSLRHCMRDFPALPATFSSRNWWWRVHPIEIKCGKDNSELITDTGGPGDNFDIQFNSSLFELIHIRIRRIPIAAPIRLDTLPRN